MTTFYVDPAGNDTNNGTSTGTPWKTLNRVTKGSYAPGDTIAFKKGGTWYGNATISNSGTSGSPILVTSYDTGNAPVLTNPGQAYMLRLNGSYIEVANLKFQDGATFRKSKLIFAYPYKNTGAITVTMRGDHANIHDNEITAVGVGIKCYGAFSLIHHNNIHDLVIAWRDATDSYGAIGISINNSDIEAYSNTLTLCRSTDSPYGADGGAFEIEGYDFKKDRVKIYHNVSSQCQGFIESTETSADDVDVYMNVSDDYQQCVAWNTTQTPKNWRVENNTFVRTRDSSTAFNVFFYRETVWESILSNWVDVRNNIFHITNGILMPTTGDYAFEWPHSHNLMGGEAEPLGGGSYLPGDGDVIADVNFVSGTDFHLAANSPAWDSGVTTALAPTTDVAGTAVGTNRDRGAYVRTDGSPGSNLVTDPGFESQSSITTGTTPWYLEGSGSATIGQNPHTGSDNGRLDNSTSNWGAIKQNVAVTASTAYRMTVYLKTSGNFSYGYAGAKRTNGTVLGEVRLGKALGYNKYTIYFTTPSGVNEVIIHAGFVGIGSAAWIQIDEAAVTTI